MDISFQSLIDTHQQPFVVIDRHYRIRAANARFCRTHGLSAAEIIGRTCHEVSHHCDRPCHELGEACPHQALFGRGEAIEVVHSHYHHDRPQRTRIRGHRLLSYSGEIYLGEQLFPLEAESCEDCDSLQMIGRSPAFLACVDHLARVAEHEAPVLLSGESGVGKELAARFIHARSQRIGASFIVINCAAVPESLFESELFGHERGAFSGSGGLKKGLFELADGGTLFLDEVGEIPLTLQAKLLRVLESGEFRRIGGTQTLKVDVRLISATNRELLDEIEARRFRLDLYYRLAGILVTLPPLRERRSDLPELAAFLLRRLCGGHNSHQLDRDATAALMQHDFPGNVRELRNILQQAMLHSRNGLIRVQDLRLPSTTTLSGPTPIKGGNQLIEMERAHIQSLLLKHQGHRARVASALGITERSLYRKLRRHGLR